MGIADAGPEGAPAARRLRPDRRAVPGTPSGVGRGGTRGGHGRWRCSSPQRGLRRPVALVVLHSPSRERGGAMARDYLLTRAIAQPRGAHRRGTAHRRGIARAVGRAGEGARRGARAGVPHHARRHVRGTPRHARGRAAGTPLAHALTGWPTAQARSSAAIRRRRGDGRGARHAARGRVACPSSRREIRGPARAHGGGREAGDRHDGSRDLPDSSGHRGVRGVSGTDHHSIGPVNRRS